MRDRAFTPIETDRLRLRRFEPKDIGAFHAYRADERVALFQSWQDYTVEQARRFVEEMAKEDPGVPGVPFQFGFAELDHDLLIGDCMLTLDAADPPGAEIGFTVAPAHQGRGVATEAVRALLAYAFERQDVGTVRAVIDADNEPSIGVVEHLGFRLVGTMRTTFKGTPCDEHTYAISGTDRQVSAG
ncbi:MAG: GNAT family N-acetyltransferase [Actinomycetota bacterium]|nr:GNAT family N-acetyltransferase [Actinomycetota bacterium]